MVVKLEELLLSEEYLREFYDEWVPAMREAQNSPQKGGREQAAADMLLRKLRKGPRTNIQTHVYAEGRPNIVVTYVPEGVDPSTKGILLAGPHTDCVPGSDDQFVPRYENGMIIGRGVMDNGINTLAAVEFMNSLTTEELSISRPVTIIIQSDEEASATDVGFGPLLEQKVIVPENFAAAFWLDTPVGASNIGSVTQYEIKVDAGHTGGHSGMTYNASNLAMELFAYMQKELRLKYPEKGPYPNSTLLQGNIVEGLENGKATQTSGVCTIRGDFRGVPYTTLADQVAFLRETYRRFLEEELTCNTQIPNRHNLSISFEIGSPKYSQHQGYVIPEDMQPLTTRVIQAGFNAAEIKRQQVMKGTLGGLTGLPELVATGIPVIATGAAGRQEDAHYYHAADEAISMDVAKRALAYVAGVVLQMDKELKNM